MSSSSSTDDDLCTVCKTSKINSIFLECGHMLTCFECGKPMAKCPVCVQDIKSLVNMDDINVDEPVIAEELKDYLLAGVPWLNAPMPVSKPSGDTQVQKPKEEIQTLSDILSEDLIPKLTNRQLKSLLKGECKGICEKDELIAEVRARWRDMKKNDTNERSSSQEEAPEDLCRICQQERVNCMFSECGHMVCCTRCGKNAGHCPICMSKKTQIFNVWELFDEIYSEDHQESAEDEEEDFIWHEGVCQGCDSQGIDYIFPDCGHVVLCKNCKDKNDACPICQQIKISA